MYRYRSELASGLEVTRNVAEGRPEVCYLARSIDTQALRASQSPEAF